MSEGRRGHIEGSREREGEWEGKFLYVALSVLFYVGLSLKERIKDCH